MKVLLKIAVLSLTLTGCDLSFTDNIEDTETTSISSFESSKTNSNSAICRQDEIFDWTDKIAQLNQHTLNQASKINEHEVYNAFANLYNASLISLTAKNHSLAELAKIDLVEFTTDYDWHDVICHQEKATPTSSLQIDVASNWLLNKSLLHKYQKYYQANFAAKSIDLTSNLWRLNANYHWQLDISLAVTAIETIHYQSSSDSALQYANAIKVSGQIEAASNEYADYLSIMEPSGTYQLHFIQPVFSQTSYVMNNFSSLLSQFKQVEKTELTSAIIPYFDHVLTSIDFSAWLAQQDISEIFDPEGQDFSAINTLEKFKLETSQASAINFADDGVLSLTQTNSHHYSALKYVADADTTLSSNITTETIVFKISLCGNWQTFDTHWRPYILIIEDINTGLIYSVINSPQPELVSDTETFCLD
ncbi:hypothetical protein [Catenovulum maritimum]|uniref:Lipoprotein n=1 Tax=Catenovulum maritimum TaxID=1513271 RepID=A0A0J8JNS8_9ALTE|nr:hypothetical protein [Catenovulum maritimum]KMT66286.1 hypothetical protein XM47_04660 [Catenovulum maritimum]